MSEKGSMNRVLIRMAGVLLAILAGTAGVNAQPGDRIHYYDRAKKKQDELRARIKEESPATITIERGTRSEKIPVADIVDIDYQIPADLIVEVRSKASREEANALKETDPDRRRKSNETALGGYRELLSRLGKLEGYKLAQRHCEFKIALLLTRLAEDDPVKLPEAIDALNRFKSDHTQSWQIGAVGKLLARAQIARGDMKAALATYGEFARRKDLPEPVHQEYELLGIRALIRAENYPEAESRLAALGKTLDKDDPQAVRVAIYQAACQAKTNLAAAEKGLQAILHSDADGSIKGLACNALGDAYRLNNRLEDAFWQYLWVDQEYNQDREEHAKALYYLSTLFAKVKQAPARAQACRDRLLTDRLFAGLEYQKLAARENQQSSK